MKYSSSATVPGDGDHRKASAKFDVYGNIARLLSEFINVPQECNSQPSTNTFATSQLCRHNYYYKIASIPSPKQSSNRKFEKLYAKNAKSL